MAVSASGFSLCGRDAIQLISAKLRITSVIGRCHAAAARGWRHYFIYAARCRREHDGERRDGRHAGESFDYKYMPGHFHC